RPRESVILYRPLRFTPVPRARPSPPRPSWVGTNSPRIDPAFLPDRASRRQQPHQAVLARLQGRGERLGPQAPPVKQRRGLVLVVPGLQAVFRLLQVPEQRPRLLARGLLRLGPHPRLPQADRLVPVRPHQPPPVRAEQDARVERRVVVALRRPAQG